MPTPEPVSDSQDQPNLVFGRTLTLWLSLGGWTHDTPLRWGKAAGFSSVADSTFNRLQRGKILQPYPITFLQLGEMNARLARADYGSIDDQALKERVAKQQPITHEDGTPWSATDFFSHFIGELDPPSWARARPQPTVQDAVAASQEAQRSFSAHTEALGLTPMEAWELLSASADGRLDTRELDLFRNVLSGWHTFTPSELQGFIDLHGHNRALDALAAWQQTSSAAAKIS
ncbi:hypothetical protein KBZ18_10040 [Synechococcus sp. Cruz-9H2]|uniref:hypothetical protein n=1 Tax=unclassified Synechococcus TaxID=2626047 RepID=UPI0020CDA730|nr:MULTISPECIES: hypothetical protein [unclassified Synechococcus]MCP9819832.1 hypothetical protein [Synechococcus sp. Cruz-9H2]MCP9844102.1 hypothetical protein [Synechococcus sp. Edmonson 11F2]MCP9856262.1 hypothetical protein [Synechococcus sp. Cruz-9C9]MCP9863547.1 hypothetical protein [Synechococcus sp. Cruz-7E5]MCP9870743.1 hypothetical protein [Synechococcus sp. Cruz-7B9]